MSINTIEGELFNASLKFYFLSEAREQKGFELYKGGGYLGITPSSWLSDMGLFYMLDKMKQVDEQTEEKFMRVRHTISLEMHEASESSLNYLTIGGFNRSIVKDPTNIIWAPIYCS